MPQLPNVVSNRLVLPGTHSVDRTSPLGRGLVSCVVGNVDLTDGAQIELGTGVRAVVSSGVGVPTHAGSTTFGQAGRIPNRNITTGLLQRSGTVLPAGNITQGTDKYSRVTQDFTYLVIAASWSPGNGSSFAGVAYTPGTSNGKVFALGYANSYVLQMKYPYASGASIATALSGANAIRFSNTSGAEDTTGKLGMACYVVTRTGATVKFYRDGVFHSTATGGASGAISWAGNQPFFMGLHPAGAGTMTGRLGPVMLWDRVLNDGEIAAVSADWSTVVQARMPIDVSTLAPVVVNPNASVAPSAAVMVSAATNSAVVLNAAVAPNSAAMVFGVTNPTAVTTGSANVTPASAVGELFVPNGPTTVGAGVDPAAAVSAELVTNPVGVSPDASVSPASARVTMGVSNPAATTTGNASVTPASAAVVLAVTNPSAVTTGSANVTPASAQMFAAAVNPAPSVTVTVTPAAARVIEGATNPTGVTSGSANVTPTAAAGVLAAAGSVVTTTGNINVTPASARLVYAASTSSVGGASVPLPPVRVTTRRPRASSPTRRP